MRRLHAIFLCSLTTLLLSGAIPTLTPTADANPTPPSSCPTGGVPNQTTISTQVTQAYFQDDNRLGPKFLPKPKDGPIGELLDKYNRFQAMGPNKLLDCYWRVNATPPGGGSPVTGWVYPPAHGFVTDANGQPISQRVTVGADKKLELFGNPFTGQFLAPEGTPYSQLAIPPSNLDTFENVYPFNYHLFLVCRKVNTDLQPPRPGFEADEGRIAPWFQQPGLGIQDYLFNTNVGTLKNDGFLRDITSSPTTPNC